MLNPLPIHSPDPERPAGSGIGLALSRRIASAHGGRIVAGNNQDGPGATFRVILPTGEDQT